MVISPGGGDRTRKVLEGLELRKHPRDWQSRVYTSSTTPGLDKS
jgi:hypothetical protein